MTKFTATFSNGQTITRNSDNAYAFAYAIIRADGTIKDSGFSADPVNAAKAASPYVHASLSSVDMALTGQVQLGGIRPDDVEGACPPS